MGDLWSPANTDIGKRSGRPSAARIFNANRCALPPRAPMPPPPGEVSRQAQRSRDGRGRGTRGRETRSRAAEGVGPYGGDGRFLRRGCRPRQPASRGCAGQAEPRRSNTPVCGGIRMAGSGALPAGFLFTVPTTFLLRTLPG